jgi:hypothetical protein
MEGNLLKWTNYLFGWCERYFVLKGNILYYYLKKGDKPKGRFHLGVCQINFPVIENRFEIDTGLNIIYLKANNKVDKDEWTRCLKAAKREADNKLVSNYDTNTPNNFNTPNNYNSNFTQNIKNEAEFSSNRNSFIVEDRLLKKANSASITANNLLNYNKKFSEILERMEKTEKSKFLQELKKLNSDYNVNFIFQI